MTLILAELPQFAINLMVVGFLLVCLIMILTVLIQKPQGGGLSGAFGSGAGSGQTAFGARTGDALTVATIGIFVFYIVAAVGLNYVVRPATAAPDEPTAQAPAGEPGETTTTTTDGAAPATGTTPTTTPGATETPAPAPAPAPGSPSSSPAGGEPSGTPSPAPGGTTPPVQPETPPAQPETPPTTPPTTPPATTPPSTTPPTNPPTNPG
jgi:preprotein translocase subunit SecG